MAEIVVVAVLTVLCFIAGLTGGRRIAASAMAPAILLFLAILGNHSSLASVPPGTAFFTTNGWLVGALTFIVFLNDKKSPGVTDSPHGDQSNDARSSESLMSR